MEESATQLPKPTDFVPKKNKRYIILGIVELLFALFFTFSMFSIWGGSFADRKGYITDDMAKINAALKDKTFTTNLEISNAFSRVDYACGDIARIGYNTEFIAYINNIYDYQDLVDSCFKVMIGGTNATYNPTDQLWQKDIQDDLTALNASADNYLAKDSSPSFYYFLFPSASSPVLYLLFFSGIFYLVMGLFPQLTVNDYKRLTMQKK